MGIEDYSLNLEPALMIVLAWETFESCLWGMGWSNFEDELYCLFWELYCLLSEMITCSVEVTTELGRILVFEIVFESTKGFDRPDISSLNG